jgi:hypothetical protein
MMTLIKNRLWCAVLILTAQFGAVQAQTVVGFDFDTSNYPAWDLSGSYTLDQPITGAGGTLVPLTYTVYITHDAKGKLSGSGMVMVNVDGAVVAASYTLKGNVSGGGNDTRANFSVNFNGDDWFYGIRRTFNGHVSYKLNVDPAGHSLFGTASGSISIQGSGSSKIKTDVVLPLPTGVDGSWSVNMVGLTLKQFIGTGTIEVAAFHSPELPGGWPPTRILYMELKGSYNSSKNQANANLDGIDEDTGSNLTVKIQRTDEFPYYEPFPVRMSGKVLGQKIKWEMP